MAQIPMLDPRNQAAAAAVVPGYNAGPTPFPTPQRRLVPLDDAPAPRRLVPLDEPAAGSGPAAAAPPSSAPVTPSVGAPPPAPTSEGGAPLPGSTLGPIGQAIIDSGAGAQSLFGWGPELAAGMVTPIETVVRWFQGKGFSPSEAFNEAWKFYEGQDKAHQERSPIAYGVGEVAGSIALPGAAAKAGLSPLANAAARGAGVMPRLGAAAVEGAGYAALQASGDAETDKLGAAMRAAPVGAATGAVAEKLLGGARQINKAAKAASRSGADMATEVAGKYAIAKGAHLKAKEFNDILLDSAKKAQVLDPNGAVILDASRITKGAHPVASEVQQLLKDKLVRSGTGKRVPTLEQTQELVQDIMKARLPKASGEDRDMVQAIGERLMKHVDAPPASRFIDPNVGLPAAAGLKTAHDTSRRGKLVKKLEQKVSEAMTSAANTGKKANPETIFNEAMRTFLKNPASKNLTPEERLDLEKLRIGGLGRITRGALQKLEPHWATTIASMAAALHNPMFIAPVVAGKAASMAARRAGRKVANRQLQEAMRRLSTGEARKEFLKKVKPRTSPFAAAISGQMNDGERDR